MGPTRLNLGMYVGKLLLEQFEVAMLQVSCSMIGAVCRQLTGLPERVSGYRKQFGAVCPKPTLLQGVWVVGWQPTGTYRSCGVHWTKFGAVGWQPTGPMGRIGLSLGLYVGNLQEVSCCRLETYRSCGPTGIVCRQPTGLS